MRDKHSSTVLQMSEQHANLSARLLETPRSEHEDLSTRSETASVHMSVNKSETTMEKSLPNEMERRLTTCSSPQSHASKQASHQQSRQLDLTSNGAGHESRTNQRVPPLDLTRLFGVLLIET